MQIHEVTQINDSILSTMAQDFKGAVSGAIDKVGAVMDTPGGMTTARGYGAALDKAERAQANATLQQYQQQQTQALAQQTIQKAQQLAQQWGQLIKNKQQSSTKLKSAPVPLKPTGQYAGKPAPGTVIDVNAPPQVGMTEADQPIMLGGRKLEPKNPNDAKILASMRDQGTLPGAKATSPSKNPRTIMTGTRAKEFKDWANSQLTSQITGTNQTLSLSDITGNLADPVSQQLAQLLPDILMKNDLKAVEQYLTIAMKAMQKIAAEKKAALGVSTRRTAPSAGPVAGELLPRYVNATQLSDLKQLAKNPQALAQIKRELGIP